MSDYIYVKLIKKWGGFKIGDVVRFGTSKGEARIAKGEGVEVKKQKAVNGPAPGEVETATITPKAETAEVTPKIEKQKIAKKKAGIKKKGS